MIRYLTEEEKGKCKGLWQEAFPQDSEAFLEYYFNWKTEDNQVLVKEDEAGRILSMAHLNPYRVRVKGKLWKLNYIVGVATAAHSRRQGHMRDILGKMLLDMYEEGMPFCYLMPASEVIYLPFGFRFIFSQPLWQMKVNLPEGVRRERILFSRGKGEAGSIEAAQEKEALMQALPDQRGRKNGYPAQERLSQVDQAAGAPGRDTAGELAFWMNRWLDERYQVYALRDEQYMEGLERELESENGRIYGWYDRKGELKALQAEWGLHKREQRFLYSMEPDWVEAGGIGTGESQAGGAGAGEYQAGGTVGQDGRQEETFSPAIMARITNVNQMMEVIGLNDEAPCDEVEVLIRIRDEWIPGNQGLWRWKLNAGGSRLTHEPPEPGGAPLFSTEVLDIDVASLGTWLFGYDTLDHLGTEQGAMPPWWCRFVEPLRGIFLDEIV